MLTRDMIKNHQYSNWIKYNGEDLESGRYLICYAADDEPNKCFMEEVYYLHEGDRVHDERLGKLKLELEKIESNKPLTAEDKLLKAIFGGDHIRTINKTGFYMFHWSIGNHGQGFEYLPNYENFVGHIQFLPDCPPCYREVIDPYLGVE